MMSGSDEQPPADDNAQAGSDKVGDDKVNESETHEQQQDTMSTTPTSSDRDQAISHLQESSAKLGNKLKEVTQEVDKKIGLTQSLAQIGSKVQEVDKEHHVTEQVSKSVAEVGSSLTSWWKTVDAACGISTATQKVSNVIKEGVIEPAAPHIQRTWSATQQQLQHLDEQHQITSKTASALASGAEFIAKTLDVHPSEPEVSAGTPTEEKKDESNSGTSPSN